MKPAADGDLVRRVSQLLSQVTMTTSTTASAQPVEKAADVDVLRQMVVFMALELIQQVCACLKAVLPAQPASSMRELLPYHWTSKT